MKFLAPTLLIAVAAVMLTPIAAPLAAPITTLFNTGVDASGAPLAYNAAETHYSLISAPPTAPPVSGSRRQPTDFPLALVDDLTMEVPPGSGRTATAL